MKATEWAFDRIKEAFVKVAKNEARTLSTVQVIMIRSTDYLRRIIAPAGGQGGDCNSFPTEDYVWWVSGRKSTQIGGVRSVEKNMDWREPNRLLVVQTGDESTNQAKVFKAHAVMWEFDQCVEVAGEPARGWRQHPTEHRDEPL